MSQETVSTHSRLKAAGGNISCCRTAETVSTHSRLKAAGFRLRVFLHEVFCFNTQPPEGGW